MKRVRVAAHVHSLWSYDGTWSLTDVARCFRRRGYDVVLMAEHDRTFDQARWEEYQHACADASRDGIVLIPGLEYEDADNVVHVAVWGAGIPFLGKGRPTIETLRAAADHDGAHAARASQAPERDLALRARLGSAPQRCRDLEPQGGRVRALS